MAIACPDCGAVQELPVLPRGGEAICFLCNGELEKTSGRSIAASFACSLATFMLLIPGLAMPLVGMQALGLQEQSRIGDGIVGLWGNGWYLLAALTVALVIAAPLIRFALLSSVLGALLAGFRPRWLGPVFRWAVWLDAWAMTDVFMLAAGIGFYRLVQLQETSVSIQIGGACFLAAGFLSMLSRATLDRRTVWRAIEPEANVGDGVPVISCLICDLVQPADCEGEPCPRCGNRFEARKADSLERTAALLIAAFLCFFPANILPMEVSNQLGSTENYTIFTGVSELFENGLWPLGIIIFCTSILIPVAKIAAIAWCLWSVWYGSTSRLVLKTKIFRLVAELGRWSETDPFTIVFFVPMMNFGVLASADAAWGATAFIMMTFLTMLASNTFDPRLMWDAASPAGA
jgi:paraquat-inducible protein A